MDLYNIFIIIFTLIRKMIDVFDGWLAGCWLGGWVCGWLAGCLAGSIVIHECIVAIFGFHNRSDELFTIGLMSFSP